MWAPLWALLSSFTAACFQAFSLSLYFCLIPLSPSLPPLWWYMLLSPWNTGSEPNKPSLLMATSSVLGTLLDNPSTSVYRPIGALVCKPHEGRVAQLSNMAPFYLWSLYLLYWVGSWTWGHSMSTQLRQCHKNYIRWCPFNFHMDSAVWVQPNVQTWDMDKKWIQLGLKLILHTGVKHDLNGMTYEQEEPDSLYFSWVTFLWAETES